MSSKKTVRITLGPGFMGTLGIVFICLKLTGYIAWSWWLVTLPLWGPVVLPFAVIAGFVVLVLAICVALIPLALLVLGIMHACGLLDD